MAGWHAAISLGAVLCYVCDMTKKSATQTTSNLADDLALSNEARARLLASLEQAQQRIDAGQGIDFDPATFQQHLMDVYRSAKRKRR